MDDITSKIYEIRGQESMLDSEIVVTKCHDYFFDKIVMHYDIVLPILLLINFADASAKLEMNNIII